LSWFGSCWSGCCINWCLWYRLSALRAKSIIRFKRCFAIWTFFHGIISQVQGQVRLFSTTNAELSNSLRLGISKQCLEAGASQRS
jgi:hypothetical protein